MDIFSSAATEVFDKNKIAFLYFDVILYNYFKIRSLFKKVFFFLRNSFNFLEFIEKEMHTSTLLIEVLLSFSSATTGVSVCKLFQMANILILTTVVKCLTYKEHQ